MNRRKRDEAFSTNCRQQHMSSYAVSFSTVSMTIASGLAGHARRVLNAADPAEKVRLTREAVDAWRVARNVGGRVTPPARPARPAEPVIVGPGQMPGVKESTAPSNVYYLHSLAHVELNAVDLSFDTMIRFGDGESPSGEEGGWYDDWIAIASDEARHFSLLDARLRELGSRYGALPAHGIVWDSADVSQTCRKDRLALGQLVQEARGLDAGPRLAARLRKSGDSASADLVQIIADEELEHVRIGVKWFVRECEKEESDPVKEFHAIAMRLSNPGAFVPPFDEERRMEAGMSPEWYEPVAEAMREQVLERRRKKQLAQKQKEKFEGTEVGVAPS